MKVSKGSCHICLEDNGPGIPQDILNNIFDAFVSGKSEGLGVGLALSKSIIEQHQGQVIAESILGQGAKFCIDLPVEIDVVVAA